MKKAFKVTAISLSVIAVLYMGLCIVLAILMGDLDDFSDEGYYDY